MFLNDIKEFLSSGTTRIGANALFFAFHLLGEWWENPLIRRLQGSCSDPAIPSNRSWATPRSSRPHRVMASVFDGDPAPLLEIVRNKAADKFIRSRMIDAISMLTLSGELAPATTAQFLRDCCDVVEQEDGCFVWNGWLNAVAWFGLVELKPQVQQAYDRGSVDRTWVRSRNSTKTCNTP